MKEGRSDRRQFGALRIPAQLRIEFGENPVQEVNSINVSQSGVLIQGSLDIEVDEFIRLKIFLPPQQNVIHVLARVARKFLKTEVTAVGVQFIEISSADQNTWLEYISRIEALTLSQSTLTSTSHILQNRKLLGRGSQSLVFRFSTKEAMKKFLTDFQSDHGFFIPTPILKSIGETLEISLVAPDTNMIIDLDGEVVAPHGQFPSAERMGLKIRMIQNAEISKALEQYL